MKRLWLGLMTLCLSWPGEAAAEYTITDLGAVASQGSVAEDINNVGQVTGTLNVSNGNAGIRAFLYSGGTLMPLGTLNGRYSYGFGINNLGHVVGVSDGLAGGANHAFFYDGQKMIDLGTLGGVQSSAFKINDHDQVVGVATLPSGSQNGFLYSGGQVTDIDTLGWSNTVATDINNLGLVIGYGTNPGGNGRAFLYDGTSLKDLGTLGGAGSQAYGINDSGDIVGMSDNGAFTHAFLYSGGKMTDLGSLGDPNGAYSWSIAKDINNYGQVVGISRTQDGRDNHAFLYSNGVMIDLNTLIPSDSGWDLNEARAINDQGQIVGYGSFGGDWPHAFLLTPVPEPSGKVLGGIGALALIVYGWRLHHSGFTVSRSGAARVDWYMRRAAARPKPTRSAQWIAGRCLPAAAFSGGCCPCFRALADRLRRCVAKV